MKVPAAVALVLALSLVSCSDSEGTPSAGASSPVAPFQGPPVDLSACSTPPPPAPIPAGFPDIEFPPGSQSVEPQVRLDNGIRVDLRIPLSVKAAQRFFIKTLRASGRRIVATDYEGFEAEVYFAEPDGRPGLIRLLIVCRGNVNGSVEIFNVL